MKAKHFDGFIGPSGRWLMLIRSWVASVQVTSTRQQAKSSFPWVITATVSARSWQQTTESEGFHISCPFFLLEHLEARVICFTTNENIKTWKLKEKQREDLILVKPNLKIINHVVHRRSFHFKASHDFYFPSPCTIGAGASLIEKSGSRPNNLSRGISATKTDVKINYDTALMQRERTLYLSSAKGNFLVSELLVSICHRTVGAKFLCENGMLIAFGHVKLGWNRHFTKFFFLSRNCRFWIFLARWVGREGRRVFIIARLITQRRVKSR